MGPDPSPLFRCLLRLVQIPWKFFYILYTRGCTRYVYCIIVYWNFLLLTSKEKLFGPPHFLAGDTTACTYFIIHRIHEKYLKIERLLWLDGAEVSASGWGSGGPRFQSHPRLTFQSCSRYQLNQLGSKAASESTFKKSNTCGVSNTRLYFTLPK